MVRKASATATSTGLPPARIHVLQRLTQVVKQLFEGRLSEEKAGQYARELETAIWSHFKEVVAGKETAGGRYK